MTDDAAWPAPGLVRLIGKILEQARRLAGHRAPPLGFPGLRRQYRLEARVGRQAEDIADAVGFAPGHHVLAAEARIAAQHDPHLRPAGADPGDDPRHLLDGAGGAVDVGGTQLGAQQEPAAENVKRQVAIAVVVAMEEPALLRAVDRVIGRIEVQHDLLGRARMRIEEDVDEQRFQARRVVIDLVILLGVALGCVLEVPD